MTGKARLDCKGGFDVTLNETGKVRDKVVVVTGGARGMGKAYVSGFLDAGAKVVATDKSWLGAQDFRADLERSSTALPLEMDVTNDAQIDKAFEMTLRRFGTVDVLINNAAMRQRDLFPPSGKAETLETKDEDWFKLFGVNVFGVLKVIRRFIKPMIEKRSGSIVNIVSSGILSRPHGGGYVALRPHSREMPYMASKGALATLSFYLADEVKKHNVAVNLIIPGHTRTTGFDEQNSARLAQGAPPGRHPVVPEHVVPLAVFLAAQDGSGCTGMMFDALQWNKDQGLGGDDRWLDRSFSYEALLAAPKS
jgi:NAD(P)-dependent dehydrogenase (short-subunit alcohol dehydrogenase family)